MIILTYDITSDKKRTRLSKFLEQYGERIQYSVFKLKNSKRVLSNVMNELEHKYKKYFDNTDSVYILNTCEGCDKKIVRYGNALHELEDVVYLE
jgi:CRISPR-associated protein Cas2